MEPGHPVFTLAGPSWTSNLIVWITVWMAKLHMLTNPWLGESLADAKRSPLEWNLSKVTGLPSWPQSKCSCLNWFGPKLGSGFRVGPKLGSGDCELLHKAMPPSCCPAAMMFLTELTSMHVTGHGWGKMVVLSKTSAKYRNLRNYSQCGNYWNLVYHFKQNFVKATFYIRFIIGIQFS